MKKLLEQEKQRKAAQINRLTVGNAIAGKLLVSCPEIIDGTVTVVYGDDRDVMQTKQQSKNLTAWAILLSSVFAAGYTNDLMLASVLKRHFPQENEEQVDEVHDWDTDFQSVVDADKELKQFTEAQKKEYSESWIFGIVNESKKYLAPKNKFDEDVPDWLEAGTVQALEWEESHRVPVTLGVPMVDYVDGIWEQPSKRLYQIVNNRSVVREYLGEDGVMMKAKVWELTPEAENFFQCTMAKMKDAIVCGLPLCPEPLEPWTTVWNGVSSDYKRPLCDHDSPVYSPIDVEPDARFDTGQYFGEDGQRLGNWSVDVLEAVNKLQAVPVMFHPDGLKFGQIRHENASYYRPNLKGLSRSEVKEALESYKSRSLMYKTAVMTPVSTPLYQAHKFDERGRVQPLSGMLTTQGTGYAKSNLQFANGVELTEKNWKRAYFNLKVFIAREFGYIEHSLGFNKTLEEQAAFAQSLIKSEWWDKLDSYEDVCRFINRSEKGGFADVQDMYSNDRLARRADEWPAWAAVRELKAWQQYMRGNGVKSPVGYVSHFVAHVDGTNNGLQHMSAILRNRETALGCNVLLHESGRQTDAYGILAAIAEQLEQLSGKGTSTPESRECIKTIKELGRDLAKDPLMILAYGASESTIENKIAKSIKKAAKGGNPRMIRKGYMEAVEQVFPACLKVTEIIKRAMNARLDAQFGKPDENGRRRSYLKVNVHKGYRKDGCKRQKWVEVSETIVDGKSTFEATWKESGEQRTLKLHIAEDNGVKCWQSADKQFWQKYLTDEDVKVSWYTEDGFYAEYLEKDQEPARIRAGQISVKMSNVKLPYDDRKMAGAASPNFIHSGDANHLRRTVLLSDFDILGIHDSYGCHITNVDQLKQNIVDAWIQTHSRDNLNHFLERIWLGDDVENSHHHVIPEFELEECREAKYMFS